MSNSLAIAAVTLTLRNLISAGVNSDMSGTDVTTRPPDKARNGGSKNQINLFLYQTSFNAAFRNMDMPNRVKPGETGAPPLPLNLSYLMTAYGENDDDALSHRLLGRAMSVLHDHALLDKTEIQSALPESDLGEQLEKLHITHQPLPIDEMSKLWTIFQTQYRISTAYEVSVVLIESTRPVKAPLPVLTRGSEDRGVETLTGSLPFLEEVRPVKNMPGLVLGDKLSIRGRHLLGDAVQVLFRVQRVSNALQPAQLVMNDDSMIVASLPVAGNPNDPAAPTSLWPAGFYTAEVVVKRGGEPDRTSNRLAFSLAPAIAISPNQAAAGDINLTVTSAPMVWPGQRVSLLLGDRELPSGPHPAKTQSLTFPIKGAEAGEYVVRLRVEGVDSIPLDPQSETPRFAANQKLKVT